MSETVISGLLGDATNLTDETVALRRYLHERPELGLTLPQTQHRVLEELAAIGLQPTPGKTTSGITAVIEGDHDGPTMLLRADMDALPLHEDTDISYKSKTDDLMHACGHDLHVSMLVSAAKLLQARRRDIHGRVLLMFQPGEEGYHGAREMINEGLLTVAGPISRAFAIHVSTVAPTGVIASRGGPLMASSDNFTIKVIGRGGHASAPHHAVDPITIACEIVQSLQHMITRRIDAFDPAVLTIGRIEAGTTNNVIPETANILGTIRAVSERTRTTVHDGLKRVAENIAAAHEGAADVVLTLGYPVTINNDHVAGEALRVAAEMLGDKRAITMKAPVMGSEDWSYVLQNVPGAMAFLGATPLGQDPFQAAPNHSNRAFFDEGTMPTGAALYAAMALDHLSN
jgi:amidohydrolase